MELFLNDKLGKITIETEEPNSPTLANLVIAHGAGAGMHHPFMVELANSISKANIRTIRFNFPYMEQGRKSPGSPNSNIETWRLVIEHIREKYPEPIFLSGKSYGGRMASHLLATNPNENLKGIIYYGFPLHAPGKDSKDRANHLSEIMVPQLFMQGSKDKLANLDLMKEVIENLSNSKMEVIEDGDHSFNVPKRIGKTKEQVITFLATSSSQWIKEQVDK